MNDSREVLDLLQKPVDIQKLIKEIMFDLDNFEEANRRQPRLFLESGKYLTGAVLQKARAENRLESLIAEKGLEIREQKTNGKKGFTDKGVADLVNADPFIRKAKRNYAVARAMEVWAKQLLEAYNHRLQVLSNITKIRTGEMATELRAVKERAAVDDIARKAEKVRKKYEDE
jgi:hypothetical protein